MNFKEAYQKMLEGKKVKRKGWEGWQYYKLIGDNMYYADKLIASNVSVENALANDWEVVEERTVVEETKSKVWKPSAGELYFYVNSNGEIEYRYYKNRNINDKRRICNIGNYFKTDEEAEHMVEKLKVIRELQDFALEHNDEEIDWNDVNQEKLYLGMNPKIKSIDIFHTCSWIYLPFNIYFTSEEIAEKAIETIGEDRIKKYYFDMED